MEAHIARNKKTRYTAKHSILVGVDWLVNNVVFPIRLRRWYFFNVSSKRARGQFPLEYSLRTHFIGAVIIRKSPIRALVPQKIRERWKQEVAAALARQT